MFDTVYGAEQSSAFEHFLDNTHPISTQFLMHPARHWDAGHTLAVADGSVIAISEINKNGGTSVYQLVLRHVYFENADRKIIYSNYELNKRPRVRKGDIVKLGSVLGEQTNHSSHFTLSEDYPNTRPMTAVAAAQFLQRHRKLFNPFQERNLLVIDTNSYRMRIVKDGHARDFEIGIGQAKGSKQFRGDNKTPRGMYFITNKHKGQFSGPAAAYFGGYWMKLNYPNAFDAERGLAAGWINETQATSIKKAWEQRNETLQQTNLGGGIGLHAWAHEWSNNSSRHMSWGCVVLHPNDMAMLFDTLPVGTMVILL